MSTAVRRAKGDDFFELGANRVGKAPGLAVYLPPNGYLVWPRPILAGSIIRHLRRWMQSSHPGLEGVI